MNPSERIPTRHHTAIREKLGLSEREFQIALRIVDGWGKARIARSLGISIHTVDSHMRRIYRKLNVRKSGSVAGRLFAAYLDLLSLD